MSIQLELNIENKTKEEQILAIIEQKFYEMDHSMGKIRRSLFAQIGELKKICSDLQFENAYLKEEVRRLSNEKTNWTYLQGDSLFDLPKSERRASQLRCVNL